MTKLTWGCKLWSGVVDFSVRRVPRRPPLSWKSLITENRSSLEEFTDNRLQVGTEAEF